MAVSFQVTFDCADPARLSRFWAAVLDYQVQPPPEGFASWDAFLDARGVPPERRNDASAIVDPAGVGARVFFQRVPEGKVTKNRVHLDVNVSGGLATPLAERKRQVDATVERIVALGATRHAAVEQTGEYWVVMADPEGNEFCLQ